MVLQVQQVLAEPGQVERFLDPEDAVAVRGCFAGLHPVGPGRGSEADLAVQQAVGRPERWVLKPQREGGGNNFYGDALATMLLESEAKDLADLILMQRIMPPFQPAWLVRGAAVSQGPSVSELGVFGTFLAADDQVLLNCYGGHILRTKLDGTDEGGVATGYAYLSSPLLL